MTDKSMKVGSGARGAKVAAKAGTKKYGQKKMTAMSKKSRGR